MISQNRARIFELAVAAMFASLLLLPTSPVSAAKAPKALAQVEAAADLVTFQPQISYSQVRVIVTGPAGFEAVATFDAGKTPAVDLPGADGLYKYELRFSPVLDQQDRELLAAAREAGTDLSDGAAAERIVQSGWFTLMGGALVPDDLVEESDKVVLTNADGVIRNSLCVGFDCPNSPTFSDSTILMMENNTRIKFGDTSNSPFPRNDWEIEANSSSSGGASYLGFNDCGSADNDGGCATDLVFAVESGARQSALYIESDGDVGLGTSNPVVDLHIVTGNTPTLRLDQDGSSGFAPQVWDLAGNEANFFVRDVTNGSRLPLRIRPDAPTSSIDINGTGNVGFGTASPAEPIHVSKSGPARFKLTNTTIATSATQDPDWTFNSNGTLRISAGADAAEFVLDAAGNLTLLGTLTITGGCTGCDAVFQPGFEIESIEEHAAYMWEESHLPAVGPTSEGKTSIDVFQKTAGILQELEKAHIYIEQLHETIKELASRVEKLESQ